MNRIFVFLVSTLITVHGYGFPFHESALNKQAEKFCSCHDGVRVHAYLEVAAMMRVVCNDDTKTILVFGKKISKICETNNHK